MIYLKKLLNSTVLGAALGVLLVGYAVFAFDPPTQAPPGGNVPAPINTGTSNQTKTGGLLSVFDLWVNSGLGVTGGATFGGTVQIGSFASSPLCDSSKKGTFYFNTAINKPYVCNGSNWLDLAVGGVDNDGDGVTVPADCNDGDNTKWQYLTGYQDFDGDTYTLSGGVDVCSGNSLPAGYLTSPSGSPDCYDANANAYPGQATWFNANRGDGSFDYNCDGTETLRWTEQCLSGIRDGWASWNPLDPIDCGVGQNWFFVPCSGE